MNWASGAQFGISRKPDKSRPDFEELADKLGLPEELWEDSHQLKLFAKRHANFKYVPEKLLKQWGIQPKILL